jgi:hypothetical protein
MSHDVEILYPRGLHQQALPSLLQGLRARLQSARALPYAGRLAVLNALSDALLSRRAGLPEGMSSMACLSWPVSYARSI